MAKRVYYGSGPDTIRFGEYRFVRGEVQELPDDIADALIRKGRVKEEEVPVVEEEDLPDQE